MRKPKSRYVFVGNWDSILFQQRLERILDLLGLPEHTILDTRRHNVKDIVRFLFASACVMIKIFVSTKRTYLVLHGAYSPVLWPLLLLNRVRTISILQESELNIDFVGIRTHLITLILQRSFLIVCRNEAQRDRVQRLCNIRRERCVIAHWGLKQELFDYPLTVRPPEPVLISPRATQFWYNIPVIFEAISRLKREGYRFHFVYVRFNPKFALAETHVADLILDAPTQEKLWDAIAAADLCISVPDYDGLSNTLMETLALGAMPVYSDIAANTFLKQDSRLGIEVNFSKSGCDKTDQLYLALKCALKDIEKIRSNAGFRRAFAAKHFKVSSNIDKIIDALND
ncbi:MAG: hypothetical protein AAF442_03555 [Pseudomonadota bacterium]